MCYLCSQVEAFDHSLLQVLPTAAKAALLSPSADGNIETLQWGTHDAGSGGGTRARKASTDRDKRGRSRGGSGKAHANGRSSGERNGTSNGAAHACTSKLDGDVEAAAPYGIPAWLWRLLPASWRASPLFRALPSGVSRLLADPAACGLREPLQFPSSSDALALRKAIPVTYFAHFFMGLVSTAVAPVAMHLVGVC